METAWTLEEAERVGRMERKMDDTYNTVRSIDQALRGWEGNGGLIQEVKELRDSKTRQDAEIRRLQDSENERRAIAKALGAAWGAGSALVITILGLIVAHYWR
jgi:hypothetical protein